MLKRYLLLFFLFFFLVKLSAQDKEKDSLFDKESKTFLILPLISNNPAMKTSFGALPMFFFKLKKDDEISPPSVLSLYGLYSTNKSYVFVPSARLFWNEDKNRATIAVGTLRINNDFDYETDIGDEFNLVYSELRSFISLEYSRKLIGEFYLGILYFGTKTKYKFDQGTDEQNEFTKEFFETNGITDNFVSSIGLNFSFDTRDYIYNPTKGFMFSVRPKLNRAWLGSDNDYIDTDFAVAYYLPVFKDGVLASRISGGFATGDVPFDGYQNYGFRNSLRAYSTGKYKGKHMVTLQAELRKPVYKRWGAVAFIGTGSVWGSDDENEEAFERKWLPSAGLGIRYMVSREKKINIRLDYAIGVDGNQGLYFGIMEAF